jgi:hypothetical protein
MVGQKKKKKNQTIKGYGSAANFCIAKKKSVYNKGKGKYS